MKDSGKLREITLKGWFFRYDMAKDGMELVHFTERTANRVTPGSPGRGERVFEVPDPLPQMKQDVNSDAPIRKRSPQERLASMTTKLMQGERGQDAAAKMMLNMMSGRGDMTGLTDQEVQEITGKSWMEGDPLDADTVRRVAAHYLGQAERRAEEETRQTQTRTGRKARREQERLEAQERRLWEKRHVDRL